MVTPYSGFIHLACIPFEMPLNDIKIDTLGNIAILMEKCILLYDITFKSKLEIKFEYNLRPEDKFTRIEFGKYDSPFFYMVTDKNEVLSLDFDNKLTKVMDPDPVVKWVDFSPNLQYMLVSKKLEGKLDLYLCNLVQGTVHKFKRCLCDNTELNHREIYQVDFSQVMSY
jgi:hypothetical protein